MYSYFMKDTKFASDLYGINYSSPFAQLEKFLQIAPPPHPSYLIYYTYMDTVFKYVDTMVTGNLR